MEFSKYGELHSVRHQAKKTNDLLNQITAQFGSRIEWHKRTGSHEIKRDGRSTLYFSLRGNKWANWIQFLSSDIDLLRAIKAAFPNDFPGEILEKEGML